MALINKVLKARMMSLGVDGPGRGEDSNLSTQAYEACMLPAYTTPLGQTIRQRVPARQASDTAAAYP